MTHTRMFGKKKGGGKTWRLKKEQSFLCATCRPGLLHIPVKFHEDIPNGYWVMKCTRMFTDGWTDRAMLYIRGV